MNIRITTNAFAYCHRHIVKCCLQRRSRELIETDADKALHCFLICRGGGIKTDGSWLAVHVSFTHKSLVTLIVRHVHIFTSRIWQKGGKKIVVRDCPLDAHCAFSAAVIILVLCRVFPIRNSLNMSVCLGYSDFKR
jgi:hypothetical protein